MARYDNEKNSIELLITPIREFDNELQKTL